MNLHSKQYKVMKEKLFLTSLERKILYTIVSNTDTDPNIWGQYRVGRKRLLKYLKKNFPQLIIALFQTTRMSEKVIIHLIKRIIPKLRDDKYADIMEV